MEVAKRVDGPSSLSFPKSFGLENKTTKSLQELYYTETSKSHPYSNAWGGRYTLRESQISQNEPRLV